MQVDRIFLSSTFLDFAWEREFLNTTLVPALNEELRTEGRQIDLLDLRWGVSREAGLDNHAVDICMAEIRRSRASGARPYFLYLGSDRPGWIPLPRLLGEADHRAIQAILKEHDQSAAALLDGLYRAESNFIAPTHTLRNRDDFEAAYGFEWTEAEERVRNAIDAYLDHLSPALAQRLSTPVTLQELELGLSLVDGDAERIGAMWRGEKRSLFGRMAKARSVDGGGWRQRVGRMFADKGASLEELERAGENDEAYRAAFAQWARKVLMRAARSPEAGGIGTDPAAAPAALIERNCVASLARQIDETERQPILLFGSSGCGKSVIIDQLVRGRPEAIVVRPGRERQRLDADGFASLMVRAIGGEVSEGGEASEALVSLRRRLERPFSSDVLLVVDGIDECDWRDVGEAVSWLPAEAGERLTLAITTSEDGIRNAFADIFSRDAILPLAEFDGEETRLAVESFLGASGRRLQPEQFERLLEGLGDMPAKAVATRIASTIARALSDDDELEQNESRLEAWIASWIKHLISREGHGQRLAEATLALLAAARRSVTEANLFDAVKDDAGIIAWLRESFPDAVALDTLPRTVFSRLIGSLSPLLETTERDGELHYAFMHQALKRAVWERVRHSCGEWAHDRLFNLAADRIELARAQGFDDPHSLSETVFQAASLGMPARDRLEQQLLEPSFVAAKTGRAALADTLAELEALRTADRLGSPIIRQYAEMIGEERHNLVRLEDEDERALYLRQRVGRDFASNPLRGHFREDERVARLCLHSPRIPGVRVADAVSPRHVSFIQPVGRDLAIGQKDGSISIVDGEFGNLRATLRGHGQIKGMAMVPESGRILTWGTRGDLALSSVSAARELLRFSIGSGPILGAVPTEEGGWLVIGATPLAVHRFDSAGETLDSKPFDLATGPSVKMTNDGLEEAWRFAPERIASALMGRRGHMQFDQQAELADLGDGLVAIFGWQLLVVWSVLKGEVLFSANQVEDNKWVPWQVRRDGDDIRILSRGGGTARIHLDANALSVERPAQAVGGVERIDDARLFVFRQPDGGATETEIVDPNTLEAIERQVWPGISDQGFFRDTSSLMARGVIPLGPLLLAWSVEGHIVLDHETGEFAQIPAGEMAYMRVQGPRLPGSAAMLINNGCPQVLFPNGQSLDLEPLVSGIATCTDLGDGRALLTLDDQRAVIWDADATLRWILDDKDGNNHAAARLTGQSMLLANGEIVRRDRSPNAGFSRFSTLGTFLFGQNGPDGGLLIADTSGPLGEVAAAGKGRIDCLLTAHDPVIGQLYPNVAYLGVRGDHLVTGLNGGTTSSIFPIASDDKPEAKALASLSRVKRIIATRDGLLLLRRRSIEKLVATNSLLTKFKRNTVLDGKVLMFDQPNAHFEVTAWFSHNGIGLTAIQDHYLGKASEARLFQSFDTGKGVRGAKFIVAPDGLVPTTRGFAYRDENGQFQHLICDAANGDISVEPVEETIALPLPLRERMEEIHGPNDGGTYWEMSVPRDITFTLSSGTLSATIDHRRITMRSEAGERSFFFPAGFDLLDAVHHAGMLIILIRSEGVQQLLHCGPAEVVPEQTPYSHPAPDRRALRRLGLVHKIAAMPPPKAGHGMVFSKERETAHQRRELPEIIETNLLTGRTKEAEKDMFLLEALSNNTTSDSSHASSAGQAHRLAALHQVLGGELDFEAYRRERFVSSSTEDATVLAKPWLDALISAVLTQPEFATKVKAKNYAIRTQIEAAGVDASSQQELSDLFHLVENSPSPSEPSKRAEGNTTEQENMGLSNADMARRHDEAIRLDEGGRCAEAEAIFEELAKAGFAESAWSLCIMHHASRASSPSKESERKYLTMAAEGGLDKARTNLANMLMQGEGGPQDLPAARRWSKLALDNGDRTAAMSYIVATLTDSSAEQTEKQEALAILKQEVSSGNPRALALLQRLKGDG
ncbi:MAG: hypothetical protein ACN4E6_04640 [Qipengyuania pacifica]